VGYGGLSVIKDFTWQSTDGKIAVMIGPNGCGKSTLLKALAGQKKPEQGAVFFDGKDVRQWKGREAAQKIAYLPQNRESSKISVARMVLHGRFPYISYPRHYTKEDRERVDRALAYMGITSLKNREVAELSGGEKQKVYLAMALVQETDVLLLDEPTTYLDMSCQLELLELFVRLKQEGKSILMVLHDLNHALRYADELLLIKEGQLFFKGTPKEVLESRSLEQVFGLSCECLIGSDEEPHYVFQRM
jgi:iron complex transport system ATP-binding protein